ncbi:thioredoxin [Streptomyces sp. NPDC101166]|uniref:thioredoxin n=1 Tax=Streptomyces sp. NPDC101166 TaxID=3366120 RepID=UPI00382F616D
MGSVWWVVCEVATRVGARNIRPAGRVVRAASPHVRTHPGRRHREEVTRMSSTVELTKENFDQTVLDNDFVLIDFWATWCGPCRQFAPVYEQAAEENPDLVFGKVDTEAQPELAAAFGIQSIPTLMIVRDRVAVFAQPGALPESALTDVIGQARELDMDEVRKSIEEQQAAPDGQ